MDAGLRVRQGGSGEPVLLLLHGLGATGEVWDGWRPLLARRWPGPWLAPDLPGHGGSRSLPHYTFDTLAAAVAGLARGGARAVVLGHSLGGVALALASGRFPVPVQAIIGVGIKVAWTQEELDRAQLNLYFEVSLPTPKGHRKYLVDRLLQRVLVLRARVRDPDSGGRACAGGRDES